MIRKVAFTIYAVTDMAAARGFYEGRLGLVTTASATAPWVEYDLLGGGCFVITTVMQVPAQPSAVGTIAFEVDDLDALLADLRSAGVRLADGDIVEGPHCRMMTCFDPDGNSLLLHQLDADCLA